MNSPVARCTGLFIPIEILELQELSFFEMILLSWVDALYSPEHGGCFASNEYLGQKIHNCKENTVAKGLTKLRSLGLIEDVSFDGRQRVIRALINKHVEKVQSKSGLDENPKRVGRTSNAKLDIGPTYPYIDSKVDIKDNKYIAQSPAVPRQKRLEISFSFEEKKFLNVTTTDIQTWKELYPSVDVGRELKEMQEWAVSNPSKAKSKKLWRKFILGWLQRQNEKLVNRSAYQEKKSTQFLDRHTGFQKDTRPVHSSRVFDFSNIEEGTT